MGSDFCKGTQTIAHYEVTHLDNPIPEEPMYQLFQGKTNRYNDVEVISEDRTKFLFILRTQENQEMRVSLTVLNQPIQCAIYSNYKLKIIKKFIIDPFNKSYESTYMTAKNETTGVFYTLKIIPFKGYSSHELKTSLETIYLHQKKLPLTKSDKHIHSLTQAFIYGINPDQQCIVMLYQQIQTSLLNIALYRKEANFPWQLSEKLHIIHMIVEGCLKLEEVSIVCRDLRPSNVFFNSRLNRYQIGNLANARYKQFSHEQDLLTVCGIEYLAEPKLKDLIENSQQIGLYRPKSVVYHGIKTIIRLLESLNPLDKNPKYQDEILFEVVTRLNRQDSLKSILEYIQRQKQQYDITGYLYEQQKIAKLSNGFYCKTFQKLIEDYEFKTYEIMGYQKQFSELAHNIIQRNNINNKQTDNAYILKDLAMFYEQNGTKGTEYYLNSCILFCKKAQQQLKYRTYEPAKQSLNQSQSLYIKLTNISQFPTTLVQIKRLRSLYKSYVADPQQAKNDINHLLNEAAQMNLNTQKQMKLWIASAIIERRCREWKQAEDRVRNGLNICENVGVFQSPTSCLVWKSHFLFQFGVLLLEELKLKHNPQKRMHEQAYSPQLKARIESYLKLSLQIRQRQSLSYFQISQCLIELGNFYMITGDYAQSKNYYKRSLIQLSNLSQNLCPQILAQLNYDLGSICYKLRQYKQAQTYYRQSIAIIKRQNIDSYWMHCVEGNMGLAMLKMGNGDGRRVVEKVLEIVGNQKGRDHYDYVFLGRELQTISVK